MFGSVGARVDVGRMPNTIPIDLPPSSFILSSSVHSLPLSFQPSSSASCVLLKPSQPENHSSFINSAFSFSQSNTTPKSFSAFGPPLVSSATFSYSSAEL
jgi:hypothetical protein